MQKARRGVTTAFFEHTLKQVGVPKIIVFLNKVDMVPEQDMIDLVEEEVRDLLTSYQFPGDKILY